MGLPAGTANWQTNAARPSGSRPLPQGYENAKKCKIAGNPDFAMFGEIVMVFVNERIRIW